MESLYINKQKKAEWLKLGLRACYYLAPHQPFHLQSVATPEALQEGSVQHSLKTTN